MKTRAIARAILTGAMLVFLILAADRLVAQNDSNAEGEETTWQEIAAKRFPEETVDRLAESRMAVTDERINQIFQAYVETDLPFFVTSDAILHAWHVVFEESLSRLEGARAAFLKDAFEQARDRLPEVTKGWKSETDPAAAKAIERAEISIAVPCRLLGLTAPGSTPAIEKIVAAEVARIEAAADAELPAWLGPPDANLLAIDYSRFRPVGCYDRSETLKRYFRAVRWLQLIPFRSDRDHEWLSLVVLQMSMLPKAKAAAEEESNFGIQVDRLPEEWLKLRELEDLFGVQDGWGLFDFGSWFLEFGRTPELPNVETVIEERKQLDEFVEHYSARSPVINDAIRLLSPPGNRDHVEFRILPARRLPDAVLFSKTTSPEAFPNRAFPSGLEVAALASAPLGKAVLREGGDAAVLETIEKIGPVLLKADDSLYASWFHCVRALSENVDPEAPALFRSAPWERKTCETVLASWAHLRHATVLQAKLNLLFMSLVKLPSGFIEPNPEFFSRLAEFTRETHWFFDQRELFEPNAMVQAIEIADAAESLLRLRKELTLSKPRPDLPGESKEPDPKDRYSYEGVGWEFEMKFDSALRWLEDADLDAPQWGDLDFPDQVGKIAGALESLATELSSGTRAPLEDDFPQALQRRWHELEVTCRRLEALCHKQLREQSFSEEENRWLKNIGGHFAWLEFYEGNSWLAPRDDAPKIAEVFHNPNEGQRLHAASGRPAVLYLLYPWKGQDRLCRGGVMTYYEVNSPKPLGDGDWKAKLDGENPPPRPDWAEPIVPGKLTERE